MPRSIDQSDEATDIGQTHFAFDGYGAEIWDHGRWSGEGDYGRVLCKEVHLARLSNVVLDELDKELEQSWTGVLPWADDANIFVRTSKAAERVMGTVSKFIENRLKLKINRREK